MTTTLTPRPHQKEALAGLTKTLSRHRRAQLRMACGSGKTHVGAWYASAADARIALVLTPSLALVQQTAAAWRQTHPNARLLIVCSDPTTAAGVEERRDADPYAAQVDVGASPMVTTRPDVIGHHLDQADHRLTLIVGTYHSSPAVAAGVKLSDTTPVIDLAVCDEAHQLAGRVDDAFATVLREAAMPIRQRIFMTATPVLLGNLADDDALDDLERLDGRLMLSMDDTSVFGEVAYRLSAGEAIERGLLADYRVLVVAGEGADSTTEDDAAHALVDAVRRHGVRRILTFHHRVVAGRRFAARLNSLGHIGGVPIQAHHVDGSMSSRTVRRTLDLLNDAAADRVTVVASARVLREGIDVPAADAVLFADPRSSNVDIIQIIGRALRLHPGKDRGHIIIPLPVRADEDDDDQLAASRYGHIWRVLRGLRSHDDRLAADLDQATRRWNASGGGDHPAWLEVEGVADEHLFGVLTRIVRGSSAVWEQWYGLLERETERLGSAARVTTAAVVDGRRLGIWLSSQRWLYTRGLLRHDKAERLEQLPGWSWSSTTAADARTVMVLQDLASRAGTVAEADRGTSAYEGLRDGRRRPLGRALAELRRKYRAKELDPNLALELSVLPGWTWDPLQPEDRAGVEALRSFVAWEKHTDVPADHVEGDAALGTWVLGVRRRKIIGTIPPALVDEIIAASPLGPNGETTWDWQHGTSRWLLCLQALEQYTARTGSAYPMRAGHCETVDGQAIHLYQWVALQRHQRRTGELPSWQVDRLEEVPGWTWQGRGVAMEPREPIDLGGHPHGTAKGVDHGCRCGPCLEYRRRPQRRSTPDRTPADLARVGAAVIAVNLLARRVRDLTADDRRFERPPGSAALATAASVPVGLIRDLLLGKRPPVSTEEVLRLQNTTAEQVLALYDTVGSRGRLVMSCEQRINAEPVIELIDDLVRRGWNLRWIARELGYQQLAVKITSGMVSRRVAQQVHELHVRVGDRVSPTLGRYNARPPSLADIEASELQAAS